MDGIGILALLSITISEVYSFISSIIDRKKVSGRCIRPKSGQVLRVRRKNPGTKRLFN